MGDPSSIKDIDIKIYLYFGVNRILRAPAGWGGGFAIAYKSGKRCKGVQIKRYFCNTCDEIT